MHWTFTNTESRVVKKQLAEKYGVGHTRVQNLMKRKREILASYEDDANSSHKL